MNLSFANSGYNWLLFSCCRSQIDLICILSVPFSIQSGTGWHALNINYSFSQNPFRNPSICSRNLPTPPGEAPLEERGASVSAPAGTPSRPSPWGEWCSVTTRAPPAPPAPVTSPSPRSPPPPPPPRAAAPRSVRLSRPGRRTRCQVITTNLRTKWTVNIRTPTGEITDHILSSS